MLRLTLASAIVVPMTLLASAALARPVLDPGAMSQLGHYDVLIYSDPHREGLDRGKAIGVIDATPDEVFRVATDYSKYQDFISRIDESRIVGRSGSAAEVEIVASLPWPVGSSRVRAVYRQEKLPGEIYRVHFDKIDGTMKQYCGAIYIEPFGDGRTAITYELVAEPRGPFARSTINWGIRRTVGKYVHALRQRINDLHVLGVLRPAPKTTIAQQPAMVAGALRPAKASFAATTGTVRLAARRSKRGLTRH